MIVAIDAETRLRLRALEGLRIVRMLGRRYPNPPSYDQVQLMADDGTITAIELRMEDVSEKLEVSCIAARELSTVDTSFECDDFRLTDFHVDKIVVLRRAEWLEPTEHGLDVLGENPEQQRISDPSEVPPWMDHVLVDAGVVLVDDRGSSLLLQADAFPMVMQCHYLLSSASIARGEARRLEARP